MSNYNFENTNLLIEVLIDRSGSMATCWSQTIEGLNGFIAEQKTIDQGDTKIGITLFDSDGGWSTAAKTNLERVYYGPISEVEFISETQFSPRGGTPLYDSVGQIVHGLKKARDESDNEPNVLLAIMTDGGNTDSHGYTANQVKDMLGEVQNDGFTVVYLGADQDAWSVGSTMGLSRGNVMNYSKGKMDETFKGLTASTVAYASAVRSAGAGVKVDTMSFFDDGGVKESDLL